MHVDSDSDSEDAQYLSSGLLFFQSLFKFLSAPNVVSHLDLSSTDCPLDTVSKIFSISSASLLFMSESSHVERGSYVPVEILFEAIK